LTQFNQIVPLDARVGKRVGVGASAVVLLNESIGLEYVVAERFGIVFVQAYQSVGFQNI
tara:strand:+ start:543 stop:719 length:177 start_codon:yes stop_codon:yes gene_type:complete